MTPYAETSGSSKPPYTDKGYPSHYTWMLDLEGKEHQLDTNLALQIIPRNQKKIMY